MRKIVDIKDYRECKQLIPDFMEMKCKLTGRCVETLPDTKTKIAWHPIPTWCPLEDAL